MSWKPFGEALGELLADVAQRQEGPRRDEPGEIVRQRADRGRDRHGVVVEHDDERVSSAPALFIAS
jgi:hypothetical protein